MTSIEIHVREATPDDVGRITAFQQAMAQETEGKSLDPGVLEAGITSVFDSPHKGFYIVAEVADRVVGGLLVTYEWSDWRNATFLWIQSVYVDSQWRRKVVYRVLHDHVYGIANSRDDVCGIRLYVERTNHVAQQTYDRLGMSRSHYDMFEIDFAF